MARYIFFFFLLCRKDQRPHRRPNKIHHPSQHHQPSSKLGKLFYAFPALPGLEGGLGCCFKNKYTFCHQFLPQISGCHNIGPASFKGATYILRTLNGPYPLFILAISRIVDSHQKHSSILNVNISLQNVKFSVTYTA